MCAYVYALREQFLVSGWPPVARIRDVSEHILFVCLKENLKNPSHGNSSTHETINKLEVQLQDEL